VQPIVVIDFLLYETNVVAASDMQNALISANIQQFFGSVPHGSIFQIGNGQVFIEPAAGKIRNDVREFI
jgi:hypothetical protein